MGTASSSWQMTHSSKSSSVNLYWHSSFLLKAKVTKRAAQGWHACLLGGATHPVAYTVRSSFLEHGMDAQGMPAAQGSLTLPQRSMAPP